MIAWRLPAVAAVALVVTACSDGKSPPANLPRAVTLEGTVTFQRVPVTASGLDYGAIADEPAGNVLVQLQRPDGSAIAGASAVTDRNGRYRMEVLGDADYRLAVVAELRRGSRILADVVVDSAVLEYGRALSLGDDDRRIDFDLSAGWTGGGYDDGERVAGAFAILDTIREMQNGLLAVDAGLAFDRVTVVWDHDTAGSAYLPDARVLFIGGLEDDDTDEFDRHVVAHEYAHALMAAFSRDDSPGGAHAFDDLLDETVAFSEGMATALACILLDDPVYRDTGGVGQATTTIEHDLEGGSGGIATTVDPGTVGSEMDPAVTDITVAGGYNELSVAAVVWDLFDTDAEDIDSDGVAIGLPAIWAVLRDEVVATEAFATMLAFLGAFSGDGDVLAIASDENIGYDGDDFEDALLDVGPRYTEITVDAGSATTTDAADRDLSVHEVTTFAAVPASTHKLYDWQYFRVTPDGSEFYTITVTPTGGGDTLIGQGNAIFTATDDDGADDVDSVIVEHPDADGELVFRVGSNGGGTSADFTVEVTGAPGG